MFTTIREYLAGARRSFDECIYYEFAQRGYSDNRKSRIEDWHDPMPVFAEELVKFWWQVLVVTPYHLLVCGYLGHKIVDDGSWGGPDSGGEAVRCERCGWSWSHTYY